MRVVQWIALWALTILAVIVWASSPGVVMGQIP